MSKLLLVDDEEGIRKVLSLSLQSDGYDVTTAESGQQALKLFQKEFFPIVLTDLKMPGLDGLEVLKAIKEINPDSEVILLTGHGDMESAIQSLQLGASDFITKPVSDQVLSVALNRAKRRLETRRQLKEYKNNLEKMVKDATEEIKRRYEFENKLIHRSIDGIIATDKEGKSLVYNPAAEKIFGYTEDEAKSLNNVKELYPEGVRQKIFDILSGEKEITEDIIVGKDTTIVGKNGKAIPIRFSGAILYEAETPIGSVGFFQDLREIKRLQKELIQSERLAALGKLSAGIAHEINNPLAVILQKTGWMEDLLAEEEFQQSKNFEEFKTSIKKIEEHVERARKVIHNMLGYAREMEPRLEDVDINVTIKQTIAILENFARINNIEIRTDLSSDFPIIAANQGQLQQVFLNLISNAIDAIGKDGLIEVKSRKDNSSIHVRIIDNGQGISEEMQNKIFEPFITSKERGKGTGLGLWVSYNILEKIGGTISVESEVGKGTVFTVQIPIVVPKEK